MMINNNLSVLEELSFDHARVKCPQCGSIHATFDFGSDQFYCDCWGSDYCPEDAYNLQTKLDEMFVKEAAVYKPVQGQVKIG